MRFLPHPFVYVPYYIYVAGDNTKFDRKNAYEDMNSKDVTFQVKDGDLVEILANQFFPKAKSGGSGLDGNIPDDDDGCCRA